MATWLTAGDSKARTVFNVQEDVADALIQALQGNINIQPPNSAKGFNETVAVIAQTSRLIQHLEEFRELAIAAADASGPHADRKKIGIAAGMPPSSVYRVLAKHGRPRNRAKAYDAALSDAIDRGVKGIPAVFDAADRALGYEPEPNEK